jgi:hypothetical protein
LNEGIQSIFIYLKGLRLVGKEAGKLAGIKAGKLGGLKAGMQKLWGISNKARYQWFEV